MDYILIVLLLFILTISINFFFVKFKIFIDNKNLQPHKSFTESKSLVPFSGGIILIASIIFFLPFEQIFYKIFILFFFILGFLSDTNIIFSPKKRLLLQIVITSFFLYFTKIIIMSLNIDFLDNLLSSEYIAFLFTLFCMLILINGTNFLDGVNTLVIGYYIIIALVFIALINSFDLIFDLESLKILVLTLSVIFIFNFFGKLYLGDNGSYAISFIFGFLSISLINQNPSISPYFIALLLWYPAFENLFSIIRKLQNKVSTSTADNKHLHHLLFTRSHSELGSQALQRRWYFVLRHGRVGHCQAKKKL